MIIRWKACQNTPTKLSGLIEGFLKENAFEGSFNQAIGETSVSGKPSQKTLVALLQTQVKERKEERKNLAKQIQTLTDTLVKNSTEEAKLSTQVSQLQYHINGKGSLPDAAQVNEVVSLAAGDITQVVPALPSDLPPPVVKPMKISWDDVACKPKVGYLTEQFKEKIEVSTKSLDSPHLKPSFTIHRAPVGAGREPKKNKPSPTPVYLGVIPSGTGGKLPKALRDCLRKWEVLYISFIGNSAAELLCHGPIVEQLIAGMKLLGFRNMLQNVPLKKENTEMATRKGHMNFYQRWRWGAESSSSVVSRACVSSRMEELAEKYPEVETAADEWE